MTIRDAVRVSGPDAAAYLQGQISQDIESLAAGEVAWSLVLQPTGKLDAWFRIQRVSDETFLLDIDAGHRDTLVARLRRFLLRTDATIEAVDDMIDAPLTWPGVVDPTDERQRIRAGMPRMGAELTDETIPGEGGQQLIDLSVSFTKGCYTGQNSLLASTAGAATCPDRCECCRPRVTSTSAMRSPSVMTSWGWSRPPPAMSRSRR